MPFRYIGSCDNSYFITSRGSCNYSHEPKKDQYNTNSMLTKKMFD